MWRHSQALAQPLPCWFLRYRKTRTPYPSLSIAIFPRRSFPSHRSHHLSGLHCIAPRL